MTLQGHRAEHLRKPPWEVTSTAPPSRPSCLSHRTHQHCMSKATRADGSLKFTCQALSKEGLQLTISKEDTSAGSQAGWRGWASKYRATWAPLTLLPPSQPDALKGPNSRDILRICVSPLHHTREDNKAAENFNNS